MCLPDTCQLKEQQLLKGAWRCCLSLRNGLHSGNTQRRDFWRSIILIYEWCYIGKHFWATIYLFLSICAFYTFSFPIPFLSLWSPQLKTSLAISKSVSLLLSFLSCRHSSVPPVSYVDYISPLYTLPLCFSVISGSSETQTSVYPLHMAVKIIWAFPKIHTPSIEI